MNNDLSVTNDNFEEMVIKSSIPVLLDFWAPWCHPCRIISPVLEQISSEYEGKLKVYKINIDEESELAEKHGIISIPCLVIYKDGNIKAQKAGASPKYELDNFIKNNL